MSSFQEIIIKLRVQSDELKSKFSEIENKMQVIRKELATLQYAGRGGTKHFKFMSLQLKVLGEEAKNLRKKIKKLADEESRLAKEEKQAIKAMEKAAKARAKALKEQERAITRFRGEWLSFLFAGMQLKRVFLGALSSLRETYMTIAQNNTSLGRALGGLQASWEYFKFSMFEALNSPVFIWMTEQIINLINTFSQLPNSVKIGIIVSITGLGLVGQLVQNIAMAVLAASGWQQLKFYNPELVSAVATSGKLLWRWSLLVTVFAGAIYLLYKFRGHWGDLWKWLQATVITFGLWVFKWSAKIGAGLVGAFDLANAKISDLFSEMLDWLLSKYNEFITKVADKAEAWGLTGIAEKLRKATIEFKFSTNRYAEALERFNKVQEGINESFAPRLQEWQDVRSALWTSGTTQQVNIEQNIYASGDAGDVANTVKYSNEELLSILQRKGLLTGY